ncbi:MAG: response regulator transcription factor [Bacteroidetes bacterium]|nr:response regulator transcription factor [Bacteroidota bacterium]
METNMPIKIAIADDFPALVKGLSLLINSFENCEVIIEAYNGKELINAIEQSTIKPNICFLDINMPIMDGYEALKYIKERWPAIHLIMSSMLYDTKNIRKAIELGASSFLPKEADVSEIATAINEVIEHGKYYNNWIRKNVLPEAGI